MTRSEAIVVTNRMRQAGYRDCVTVKHPKTGLWCSRMDLPRSRDQQPWERNTVYSTDTPELFYQN